MGTTLFGAVAKPADAQRIIDALVQRCMCDRSDISLMSRESGPAQPQTAAGAVKGAVDATAALAGTVLGGMFATVDAVSHSLPGGGVLRAFGSVGETLIKAGLGAAGSVAKALAAAGVPKEHAEHYGDLFERGGIVVRVDAKTENIGLCARRVLMEHGAAVREDRVEQ